MGSESNAAAVCPGCEVILGMGAIMKVHLLQWILALMTMAMALGCQKSNLAPAQPEEARPIEATATQDGSEEVASKTAVHMSSLPQSILGEWKHPEKSVIIKVCESDGTFNAHVVKGPDGPPPMEVKIFRNLRYDEANKYFKGTVFVPERKKELDATWKVIDGQLTMTVSVGPITKTVSWARP
jgi:uncharacterized protein (DUF2147 family)